MFNKFQQKFQDIRSELYTSKTSLNLECQKEKEVKERERERERERESLSKTLDNSPPRLFPPPPPLDYVARVSQSEKSKKLNNKNWGGGEFRCG